MKKQNQDGALFLGLDLSICRTGYVLINEKGKVVDQALVVSGPPKVKTPRSELDRLLTIRNTICQRIPCQTLIVAIEGLAFAAKKTTSLVQLGALNYFVREYLSTHIAYYIVSPLSLKKYALGIGRGDKEDMIRGVEKNFGIKFEDHNLCDAYILSRIARDLHLNDVSGLPAHKQEVIELIRKQIYD